MSKYHAKKCRCSNGHIHDSKKEAARCDELHLLWKAHRITALETQKKFTLIPTLTRTIELEEVYKRGEHKGEHKTKTITEEKEVSYYADFYYYDLDKGLWIIEDCKGMKTKEYIIKRKLMKQLFVRRGFNEFIET